MNEYSLSKQLIRRYKISIVVFSFASLIDISLWLGDTAPSDIPITLKVLVLISFVASIVYYTVLLREPGIKIGDERIEVKIDQDLNFWKTTWANLSHIEVKTEHINNIVGDQKYEFVCFKQPVTRDFNFLGLRLQKISKTGFRLDVFDESAASEIKVRLSS